MLCPTLKLMGAGSHQRDHRHGRGGLCTATPAWGSSCLEPCCSCSCSTQGAWQASARQAWSLPWQQPPWSGSMCDHLKATVQPGTCVHRQVWDPCMFPSSEVHAHQQMTHLLQSSPTPYSSGTTKFAMLALAPCDGAMRVQVHTDQNTGVLSLAQAGAPLHLNLSLTLTLV